MTTKKYYVYALCYPDGKPFYIGKGSGDRMISHLTQTNIQGKGEKSKIIRSLLESRQGVMIKLMFETDDEKEAYRVERSFIEKHEGLVNKRLNPSTITKDQTYSFKVNPQVHEKMIELSNTLSQELGVYISVSSLYRLAVRLLLENPEQAKQMIEQELIASN